MSKELYYPIYLVSLEQDVSRREELAKHFPKYYTSFIRIQAVDGRKLSAKEYYDAVISFFQKHNRPMSPAELGCSLSHIQALKKFLQTDEPLALIIEDDVNGTDADLELIQEKVALLSENSLLLCGGQMDYASKKFRYGKYKDQLDLYQVAKFSYPVFYATCSYVVTRKSAQQILSFHARGITLADKWNEFFVSTDINIYYSNILQHPEDLENSHIEADRLIFKNKSLLQKLLAKDGLFKAIRRMYWEVRRFGLIASGYKQIK